MENRIGTKRIISLILLALALAVFVRLALKSSLAKNAAGSGGYPMERDVYLLDTYCSLTVYEGGGEEALDAAVEALNHYDELLNFSRPESDIAKINNRNSNTVEINKDTAGILSLEREFCEETGGRLEPAIKPVSELWDFKEEKKVPDEDVLKEALSKVKSMQWDVETVPAETTAYIFHAYDSDVRIDVGAVAKGYIADRIKEVMAAGGVTSGIINLGGNVLCIGAKPDGTDFKIAVEDSMISENEYADIIDANDDSVVTAGAYERCFEQDGVNYHHILDPDTGYPARSGLSSVTVQGKESAVCDAMSTSLFIMGETDGKKFLADYNAAHGTDYKAWFYADPTNV